MKILTKMLRGFSTQPSPQGADGYRAYAIGDVHGRLDLLDQLLAKIAADIAKRRRSQNLVIFLGDLVDRGPQSAEVLERLRTWSAHDATPIFLCGNHEEVMMGVLNGEPALLADWLKFGGVECLASYGLARGRLKGKHEPEALAIVKAAVPDTHREFIATFADTFRFGDYLFVHAGIRPGVELAAQSKRDLHWIGEEFLNDHSDHGVVVVHGHTITRTVDERSNRIGLDTGAYRTGLLSAMAVEGSKRWFLDTAPEA